MTRQRGFDTLAVHAGQAPDPRTGAIQVPIYLTSTYAQDGPGGHKGWEYSRTHNPTRQALEANLAALEGGRFGTAFASGCAAATALLQTLRAGDHVVAGDDLYGGTHRLFEQVFAPLGLSFSYADVRETGAFARAMRPETRLCWVESPTNPLLKICDLGALAALCRARGVTLVVDNTFMTPFLQRPLALGAHVVVHSTTKYIGGHCDVIGGAAVTDDEAIDARLKFVQNTAGAVPGALDCFLLLRGVKTLGLRMRRHQDNAAALAHYLEAHPAVERVIWPGLPSHPQHDLAMRQQRGGGGMLCFVLRGGLPAARRALARVRILSCAESLGGVESLIEHPALMTHASLPPERRAALGIHDGLVRVSTGIEDPDDLVADLDQALAQE